MEAFVTKCLWYLVAVVLFCTTCEGLSPPYDLYWSINGAYVHLTWKHSHADEPLNGYYVSVALQQDSNHGWELTAPDFVHLDKNVRSTNIQGLIPDAVYQIKVVAFSGDNHKSSRPVTVRTKDLELLRARNLTISSITTTEALFQWEHDAKRTVHDTQFKLSCRGARQFTDKNNKLIEESDDFEYSLYASSQGKESYHSTTLQPNTKYACHMSTLAETVEGPPTEDVYFRTAFGAPTPPPKPKVVIHHNSSFTVQLYHSNERFGPISHYKIFAVPMKKETDLPINNRYVPSVPSSKLLNHAVSPQVLTHESPPTPFLVGTYKFTKLPRSITFSGNEMRLSFKPKTHYSFVTAVFTKAESEESEGLHSFSAPADPPVFISADLQEDWIKQHQPVAKHFTIIVTCTLVSVALLFTAGFLSAFASNYYKGKKRDAYFFTIADDDSSEDELYSKPTSSKPSTSRPTSSKASTSRPTSSKPSTSRPPSGGTKKEVVPLLRPSPQPSPTPLPPREDFSDSQTHYNPAFEYATPQEPNSGQNGTQSTLQDPVPVQYKYPSNSPAKVAVSSIQTSPVNSITSPSGYGRATTREGPNDPGSPIVHWDALSMYQTTGPFLEDPRYISQSPRNSSSQTGKSPQSKQYVSPQRQQPLMQLPPSAYTQLVTSVGPSSHENPGGNRPSINGGMPRMMRPELMTGARYLPPPQSHAYKHETDYARLQLQDIPATITDDAYRNNS